MSAPNLVPPLRIEIRGIAADGDLPWFVLDTAQTAAQAKNKIHLLRLSAQVQTRIIPNESIADVAPVVLDSPETKSFIEQTGGEMLTLRRELQIAQSELSKMKQEKAAVVKMDALAGETPLPFGAGDFMRDVHTGVMVRVIAINPAHPRTGNPRAGFSWENMTNKPGDPDHTGFCPLGSVGCYTKASERSPAVVTPTGDETPAPKEKSAAVASVAAESPAPAEKTAKAKAHHTPVHHAAAHHAPPAKHHAPAKHKK